jgi:hypothetical protein
MAMCVGFTTAIAMKGEDYILVQTHVPWAKGPVRCALIPKTTIIRDYLQNPEDPTKPKEDKRTIPEGRIFYLHNGIILNVDLSFEFYGMTDTKNANVIFAEYSERLSESLKWLNYYLKDDPTRILKIGSDAWRTFLLFEDRRKDNLFSREKAKKAMRKEFQRLNLSSNHSDNGIRVPTIIPAPAKTPSNVPLPSFWL